MAAPGGDEGSAGKQAREICKRIREAAPLFESEPATFAAAVADVGQRLRATTGEFGDLEMAISTNRIMVGEEVAYKSEARDNNLAFDLFRQGLRRVIFRSGVADDEVSIFMSRFAECRTVDQIDEDFVSLLWREPLQNIHYVALDGFTEKIFMSEERFIAAFRGVIDGVVPGLVDLNEDDDGDRAPRPRQTLDDAGAVAEADTAALRNRAALPGAVDAVRTALDASGEGFTPLDHLLHLLAAVLVKVPTPLAEDEIEALTLAVLDAYLAHSAWREFADAVRTLRAMSTPPQATPLDDGLATRLALVSKVVGGPALVERVAARLDPEETDFTAWVRWHFVDMGVIEAPELLGAINRCAHPPGIELLKDLLRRQGTASLDPWAERLRDPNPGVVVEVLDVILNSALGPQARPLLIECLAHPAEEVRTKAVEGLSGDYDAGVRAALLPLVRDPSPSVRQTVLGRFVRAEDRSIAPYLASAIRSGEFHGFGDDEQRRYFEALARLGGVRFLDVFREHLRLEGSGGGLGRLFKRGVETLSDDTLRRGAVSGLAVLAAPEAQALVREVHGRADLDLAAHCEVTLRLAARGAARADESAVRRSAGPTPLEDVSVGAARMGDRLVFDPETLWRPGPPRPRPSPVDVATRVGSTPSAPAVKRAEEVPISERPLLAEGEVFLAGDHRSLKVEPASLSDARFKLTSPRAALVGVATEAPAPARAIEPAATNIPGRIIEKRTTAPLGGWTHQPDATLEDILRGYLGDDEANAPASQVPGPSSADRGRVAQPSAATAAYEPMRTPAPGTRAGPARVNTPGPRRVATALPSVSFDAQPASPSATPAPVPVPTPAPAPGVTGGSRRPEVDSGAAPRPAANLEDLLKDFLDADLGD